MKKKSAHRKRPKKVQWTCFAWVLMTTLVFSSCTRTVTVKKRTYSIAGSEKDDSDKMRKRFASGFEVGEDGTMTTNKKELYVDKSYRSGRKDDVELKSFRMGKEELDFKEYRTPEYLQRQKEFRTKDSGLDREVRESDFDRFSARDDGKEAWYKKFNLGFLEWMNPFHSKKEYWDSDKRYSTYSNRNASKAMESAPSPRPMGQVGASPQDQRNTALSMDDVKKMLNPAAYSQRTRR